MLDTGLCLYKLQSSLFELASNYITSAPRIKIEDTSAKSDHGLLVQAKWTSLMEDV